MNPAFRPPPDYTRREAESALDGEALAVARGQAECKTEGRHWPAIVHRTGGISATLQNRCGRCGALLVRELADLPWREGEEDGDPQ